MEINVTKAAEHVADSQVGPGHTPAFEFPFGHWEIPQPFGHHADGTLIFPITKFMVLELAVGLLMLAIFIPLARRIRDGRPPRGRFWNMLEMVLVFVRDDVARPAIGGHAADRYVPFLWTAFFFVLFCNLFGLVPWAGSPTGALSVTATLACLTFAVVVGSGMLKFGAGKFWIGLVPHMDLPPALADLALRHHLADRNPQSVHQTHRVGHPVVGQHVCRPPGDGRDPGVLGDVRRLGLVRRGAGERAGGDRVCFLELLVAFLQAYIFAFLSALFIGMAVHQH